MLARLPVCLLALLLLSPAALAFAASHDEVSFQYDARAAPLILAAGKLDAGGALRGGVLAAGLVDARIGPVPELHLVETRNGTTNLTNVTGATLVIHSGALLMKLENASAALNASAPYAFALALSQSPFDASDGERSPALVMAGPAIFANVSWLGGDVTLVPVDATLTIVDATGVSVRDHVAVNGGRSLRSLSGGDPENGTIVLASGAFEARLPGEALVAGLGASAQQMRLDVHASDEERFVETAAAVSNATRLLGEGGNGGDGGPFGGALPEPLSALGPVFNGAVLILEGPGGGDGGNQTARAALEAKVGGSDVDVGPFAMLRSQDLALAWGDGRVGVQGTSAMTVTRDGFATTTPLTLGPVPLVSVVLWALALGSMIFFLVKRPPKSSGRWPVRIVSAVVWVVVLALVFWWWDRSFAQTFGTSLLTLVKAHGVSSQSYSQLGLVFGIEMIPWGLAGLLFALPVRIILGVLLRYRGEGSSYKRVAAAGGLVSLAIFGPIYALWIVNVLLKQALQYAPRLFGS